MMKLLLSNIKLYRKLKGGKWCKIMNFIGEGKYLIYWKQEEDLLNENISILDCESYN